MAETDLATLLSFFKAMANESRLRIVGLLAERERSVQELAELLGLKEPTVSHHLSTLKSLSLVSVRAEGVTHWHTLRVETLAVMNRSVLDPKGMAALTKEVSEETWEEKVLASFVDANGRLAVIPASRRKRWIILRWLTEQFEEDRRYPEPEVNVVIQRRHPDSATLRRELIGCRMMAREAGVYWRLPEAEWQTEGGK
jgi:hypothetical protein